MIITGATSRLGLLAIKRFGEEYELLLLDKSLPELRRIKRIYATDASILRFDITSTVSLSDLHKTLQKLGGFDYLIHFSKVGRDTLDIPYIYKVNLIGTKKLFNTVYPHILKNGIVINLSTSRAYLTPIPPVVFPLLNDPLRKTFLDEIMPHTPDAALAYEWSKFGSACFCKRDSGRWGLKEAALINIFPAASSLQSKLDEAKDCIEALKILKEEKSDPLSDTELLTFINNILTRKLEPLNGANIIFKDANTIGYLNDH